MNNKTFFLVLFSLFALFACKKPPVVNNYPTPAPDAKAESLQVQIDEIDFQYFSSKSKVNYQSQNEEQSAIVNIRMKKDSVIWLSVNKVGIEGFRALITQDSIYVIDKLNKDFFVKDFKSLSQQFNFPITYHLLQALILGNLPFQSQDRTGLKINDHYLLRQGEGNVSVENYINVNNRKLEKVEMVEKPTKNTLTLNYANFNALNNFLFPYNSALYLKYDTEQKSLSTLITIECNKAEISNEELKFPFNIPKRYEKK